MGDCHAPAASVASTFTPSQRVRMGPHALALSAKKEIGVESIGRDWTALRGLKNRIFSILALEITLLLYLLCHVGVLDGPLAM